MKNGTGLSVEEFTGLFGVVRDHHTSHHLPPFLGVWNGLMATLKYLRGNRTQADILEELGVSRPTIGRTITAITVILAEALIAWIPTVEDISANVTHLVDGRLLPCWSWNTHPELYSGKYHTTGVNVQVVTDLHGELVWVFDPLFGCVHDVAAIDTHGLFEHLDPADRVGDKGCIGRGMITPKRKPCGGDMTENMKNYNTASIASHGPWNSHRPPEELAHPPHRPPTSTQHIPHHHHSHPRPTPPLPLNKPQSSRLE